MYYHQIYKRSPKKSMKELNQNIELDADKGGSTSHLNTTNAIFFQHV